MKNKYTYTLQFSLGTAFIFVVILTSFCIAVFTFFSMSSFLRDTVRLRLADDAGIAALRISGDLHSKLQKPDDENTDEYRTIRKYLQNIRERATDIRFVYTIRKNNDGKIVFIVDAEENPEELSHLGDVYDNPTAPMLAAFEKPYKIHVENEFTSDQWGTFLSSYAPIYRSNGELEAVLGMDISAQNVIDYERNYLFLIMLIAAGATLFVAVFGILIARLISKPLQTLSSDMSRIQNFDIEESSNISSRIKEINKMHIAVENMKGGLRSFKKYVPAELVANLIQLRKEAVLGGEKKDLTIFFSDIENFTNISEEIPLNQLAKYMEIYFEKMTSTLIHHRGTVDKYIGDAIMAFWGAPISMENHASLACSAALQCQRQLDEISKMFSEDGVQPFNTRIGINTGETIVGNMGYKERFNYTALGDNVNIASRLENLNKYYGTKILISESTHDRVQNIFTTRQIDLVAVKGKQKGIRIYELITEKLKATEEELQLVALYEKGIQSYTQKDWNGAKKYFEEAMQIKPDDSASKLMFSRCEKFEKDPPPENWKGVVYMRSK